MKLKFRKKIDWIATTLLLVGGLNWGLVGILDYNLVGSLLGGMSFITRVVYTSVGASAVYILIRNKKFMK